MYELIYAPDALKQLEKLPKEIQRRIVSTLERCRIRPHAHFRRLVSSSHYRLRVGDYRIIVTLHDGMLQILVITVGHRKNIYSA